MIQLLVIHNSNKTMILNVYKNTTVNEIKNMFENKEGVPTKYQSVYFGTKRMRENNYLEDYKITEESVLRIKVNAFV